MKVRATITRPMYGKVRYAGEEFELIDQDMGFWILPADKQFQPSWMEKVDPPNRRGRPRKVKT